MIRKRAETLLKRIFGTFAAFLFVAFAYAMPAFSCTSDEIDVLGDGTQCETVKFSATTTNLNADDTIKFNLAAIGTFYVDCGADGALTQDTSSYGTISGKTVTRTSASTTTYTCTWSSAGAHTVKFGGTATGYNTSTSTAAISFYKSSGGTQAKIAAIDGDLSVNPARHRGFTTLLKVVPT